MMDFIFKYDIIEVISIQHIIHRQSQFNCYMV